MRCNKLSESNFMSEQLCWGSRQKPDGRITTPNDSRGLTTAWIDTAKINISNSNPCAVLWITWSRTCYMMTCYRMTKFDPLLIEVLLLLNHESSTRMQVYSKCLSCTCTSVNAHQLVTLWHIVLLQVTHWWLIGYM